MFWEFIAIGTLGGGMITIGWAIGKFNQFVLARTDLQTMWSNIKTEYQRRMDLILNLVETTKSYKKFEKATLAEVIKARQGINLPTRDAEMKKMHGLDKIMRQIAVVVEAYPNLKANEQHNQLMEELRVTEDRINIARTDYNDTAREYNALIRVFPANVMANMFGFRDEPFYENEPESNKAPKVDLE